jgi:hypothetical protein
VFKLVTAAAKTWRRFKRRRPVVRGSRHRSAPAKRLTGPA